MEWYTKSYIHVLQPGNNDSSHHKQGQVKLKMQYDYVTWICYVMYFVKYSIKYTFKISVLL